MRRTGARNLTLFAALSALLLVAAGTLWLRARQGPAVDFDAATAALIAAEPGSTRALLAMAKSPRILAAGARVFRANCAPCHGAGGNGVLAPNLTDRYWIHSPEPSSILKLVRDGEPSRGMPAWEPILGFERVREATVYVLTLKGKRLPGRAPQGEIVE